MWHGIESFSDFQQSIFGKWPRSTGTSIIGWRDNKALLWQRASFCSWKSSKCLQIWLPRRWKRKNPKRGLLPQLELYQSKWIWVVFQHLTTKISRSNGGKWRLSNGVAIKSFLLWAIWGACLKSVWLSYCILALTHSLTFYKFAFWWTFWPYRRLNVFSRFSVVQPKLMLIAIGRGVTKFWLIFKVHL